MQKLFRLSCLDVCTLEFGRPCHTSTEINETSIVNEQKRPVAISNRAQEHVGANVSRRLADRSIVRAAALGVKQQSLQGLQRIDGDGHGDAGGAEHAADIDLSDPSSDDAAAALDTSVRLLGDGLMSAGDFADSGASAVHLRINEFVSGLLPDGAEISLEFFKRRLARAPGFRRKRALHAAPTWSAGQPQFDFVSFVAGGETKFGQIRRIVRATTHNDATASFLVVQMLDEEAPVSNRGLNSARRFSFIDVPDGLVFVSASDSTLVRQHFMPSFRDNDDKYGDDSQYPPRNDVLSKYPFVYLIQWHY